MKCLIGEFEEQSFTQIIFPHAKTDWICCLDEAQATFINIIQAIIKYQICLVVCVDAKEVKTMFKEDKNLFFIEYESDDCWARDTSALCIQDGKRVKLLNFKFNGWGEKFDFKKDDAMTKSIEHIYTTQTKQIDFILEGGAVESNGVDTILTTSKCMLNKNRNSSLDAIAVTQELHKYLGATKILYLNYGYLKGDDTDSHIDTLARFISKDTIMYVKCTDETDEHFLELGLMENELQLLASEHQLKLIALPMSEAIYFEDERLPATYANFLFVNGAVLVPTYGVKEDEIALEIFRDSFTDRDIIGLDCSTLIKQHGSLHCVSMNFASSILLKS